MSRLFTGLALTALLTAASGCAIKPVYFETGQAQLASDDRSSDRSLDCVARRMKVMKRSSVAVVGLTDITGDSGANQTLSEQRAAYVRSELMTRGVDGNRVDAMGLGEVEAKKKRAIDRRVEFVYYRSRKATPTADNLYGVFGL